MNRLKAITVLIGAVLLLSTATASAGPNDPSYRGDDNSVHAIFDWVSDQQTAWETTLFETGPSIYPLDQTTPSASDNGLDTTILLPNFIDQLPIKLMRIQLSFRGPVLGSDVTGGVHAHAPQLTSWSIVGGSGTGSADFHWVDIEILPNPDWETITIFGWETGNIIPGNLLQIEIDTVSIIPEPATMTLLALGGLALLRLRRRAA